MKDRQLVGIACGVIGLVCLAIVALIPWPGRLAAHPLMPPTNAGLVEGASGITARTEDLEDWTRIAFQSSRDGNWEIYLARSDGSEPVRITHHPAADLYPRLNRGASQVVFASNRDGALEIYTQNTDGSGLTRLTFNNADDTTPVWSPDNTRIAFVSQRDGNWEIYVMHADGSAQTRLTHDAADDVQPAWSPDGRRIAWVRRQDNVGVLWVMNADGSDAHPITGPLLRLGHPAWSPDGMRIAFDYDADGDGLNELAVMNADGSNLRIVYKSTSNVIGLWMGSWSPDEEWLLYTRVRYTLLGGELIPQDTYVERVMITTGFAWQLTWQGVDRFPDWGTADANPPQSRIEPLPRYARAMGVRVWWAGTDIGPAGIASYDVQYRRAGTTSWADWQMGTQASSAVYTGSPATTVYFRVRARDRGGNVEPWPVGEKGDAFTTLYTWQLSGRVTDHRGQPLPRVPITVVPDPLSPPKTDFQGRYLARLTADGTHTLAVRREGYAPLAPFPINFDSDRTLVLYLPPPDDLIRNGGFEAEGQAPAEWEVQGDLPVTVTEEEPHTGLRAAALGWPCPTPCLSIPLRVPNVSLARYPLDAAVDRQGNLHVVWEGPPGRTIYHIARKRDGTWTEPRAIGDAEAFGSTLRVALAIDRRDTLHVVWNGSAGLYYSQRPAAGDWSAPLILGPGVEPDLAADGRGGVHLIYQCYGAECPGEARTFYRAVRPGGEWGPPIPIGLGYGYFEPHIAAGVDGSVHFLWYERGLSADTTGVFYRARRADGTLTPPVRLFDDGRQLEIAVDVTGQVHAYWVQDTQKAGYYATRMPDGAWSDPVVIPKAADGAHMAVDEEGGVHMVTLDARLGRSEPEGTYYRRKVPGKPWSEPVLISVQPYARMMAIDRYGILHMVWSDAFALFYQGTRISTQAGEARIRQRVTIPADAHAPTLAFMYKLQGAVPGGRSGLRVEVTNDFTTTQVFSTTTGTPWSLAWVDLQPWASGTVTVTLTLRQEAGEPGVYLLLDDVSLGSWRTPVVQSVSPSRIEPWTTTLITITGENFIATPTLRLNDIPVPDVLWVDEDTLRATLPPDLPPGVYHVWVTNPGGQEAVLPAGLNVGTQVYLPAVFR